VAVLLVVLWLGSVDWIDTKEVGIGIELDRGWVNVVVGWKEDRAGEVRVNGTLVERWRRRVAVDVGPSTSESTTAFFNEAIEL
jgi:hypothetical protein